MRCGTAGTPHGVGVESFEALQSSGAAFESRVGNNGNSESYGFTLR